MAEGNELAFVIVGLFLSLCAFSLVFGDNYLFRLGAVGSIEHLVETDNNSITVIFLYQIHDLITVFSDPHPLYGSNSVSTDTEFVRYCNADGLIAYIKSYLSFHNKKPSHKKQAASRDLLSSSLILFSEIALNEFLRQIIPVDLSDYITCIVVACYI